jgi:CelD/BcsL family acetyltransferase involved in cellulose biosynthesis
MKRDIPKASEETRWEVRLISDWDVLEQLGPQWQALAAAALEPSPSSEPWMLLPALRCLGSGSDVAVALVFRVRPGGAEGGRRLAGVFPIEIRHRFKGLPMVAVSLWNHLYCLYAAPLLAAQDAEDCLKAFFDWLAQRWRGRAVFLAPELRAEGAFFQLLDACVRRAGLEYHIVEWTSRALFRPRQSAQHYLDAVGNPHHRRQWRRQERRLAELGELRYEHYVPGSDPDPWVDAFIALEQAGWKGRNGTAFGCRAEHRAFLQAVTRQAAADGRLMMMSLRLGDRLLASKLNFVIPPGAYTFKIAFDESFQKYSPGVLLELENIGRLHEMPEIEWADSLALPDHPMTNRLWLDRVVVATVAISPGGWRSELLLAAFPLLRLIKRRLRPERSAH